jgi:hypothetical protein
MKADVQKCGLAVWATGVLSDGWKGIGVAASGSHVTAM